MTVTLFIAPGCPHCPGMIERLTGMLKNSQLPNLTIINIAVDRQLAEAHAIRSVPTLMIGDSLLSGVQSEQAIQQALDANSGSDPGSDSDQWQRAYNEAFESGQLEEVIEQIDVKTGRLRQLLTMLCDIETPLTSRIAISAVFEHFSDTHALSELIDDICAQADNPAESVRVDIAYLLGLTGSARAIPCLEKLLADDFEEVRETAEEAIDMLQTALH